MKMFMHTLRRGCITVYHTVPNMKKFPDHTVPNMKEFPDDIVSQTMNPADHSVGSIYKRAGRARSSSASTSSIFEPILFPQTHLSQEHTFQKLKHLSIISKNLPTSFLSSPSFSYVHSSTTAPHQNVLKPTTPRDLNPTQVTNRGSAPPSTCIAARGPPLRRRRSGSYGIIHEIFEAQESAARRR